MTTAIRPLQQLSSRLPALFASLLWLLMVITSDAHAQPRSLHTYTMRHALPEQVLPALSAQIGSESSITPYQQQLILNVTQAEHRRILELLGQLDVAPRSLVISVRNQSERSSDNSRYGVDGRIGTGAVEVQTNGRYSQRGDGSVSISQRTREQNDAGTQQVRALENVPALISAGNVRPVRTDRYGGRELVPVTSGFYATVRIVGNEVIVDVDQHDNRMQGRNIQTQGLQTQVRGPLGAWIALGNLQASSQGSDRDIANYGAHSATSSTDLAIKVELAE